MAGSNFTLIHPGLRVSNALYASMVDIKGSACVRIFAGLSCRAAHGRSAWGYSGGGCNSPSDRQISANGTGSQPNDCIRSLLDLRIRLFADPDIPQAIEHDGFHWDLSKKV